MSKGCIYDRIMNMLLKWLSLWSPLTVLGLHQVGVMEHTNGMKLNQKTCSCGHIRHRAGLELDQINPPEGMQSGCHIWIWPTVLLSKSPPIELHYFLKQVVMLLLLRNIRMTKTAYSVSWRLHNIPLQMQMFQKLLQARMLYEEMIRQQIYKKRR